MLSFYFRRRDKGAIYDERQKLVIIPYYKMNIDRKCISKAHRILNTRIYLYIVLNSTPYNG